MFFSFTEHLPCRLVKGGPGTSVSSTSFVVSLAILQVYVFVVVSLESVEPCILDAVVAVIGSSFSDYISCISLYFSSSIYKTLMPTTPFISLIPSNFALASDDSFERESNSLSDYPGICCHPELVLSEDRKKSAGPNTADSHQLELASNKTFYC